MRQKLITLCPTSFELASRKANFSAWVRRKLMEEVERAKPDVLYGMYCRPCFQHFKHPVLEIAKIYRCRHCDGETEFEGRLE